MPTPNLPSSDLKLPDFSRRNKILLERIIFFPPGQIAAPYRVFIRAETQIKSPNQLARLLFTS